MSVQNTQKVLIVSGLFMCFVSDGYIVGQLSGMVAEQQSPHSDVPLDDDEMSWVASVSYVTILFGLALAAVVTERFGRRIAITILSTPVAVCWVGMFFAQRMLHFMTVRIILGVCFGGVFSHCVLTMAEYTAPKERGFYLNMTITAATSLGIAISNVLGVLFHWRTVALLGIIPAATSALIPLLWVESPAWLASKGRFKECATSFETLHGNGKAAAAELQLLLKVEKEKQSAVGGPSESMKLVLKKLTLALKQNYLWKIAALSICLHLLRVATSRVMICTFITTIIQDITGESDILRFTLVADGCLVFGSFVSCLLIDRMRVRTLLFSSGLVAFLLLITLSISLYCFQLPWLNCMLLGLFIVIVNAGPYPLLESLFGEIYPLEIKPYCMAIFGAVSTIFMFCSIRLALPFFATIGYSGVFLVNSALGLACLGYLWFFLPETKGRTLQEIELYFKNNAFDGIDDLLKDDRSKLCV